MNQKTQFIQTAVKMVDTTTSPAVSLISFVGREKSGNHKWASQKMNIPNHFSMLIYFQVLEFFVGDKTFPAEDLRISMSLISVFSDNEGTGFQIREARQNFFVLFEQKFNFFNLKMIFPLTLFLPLYSRVWTPDQIHRVFNSAKELYL